MWQGEVGQHLTLEPALRERLRRRARASSSSSEKSEISPGASSFPCSPEASLPRHLRHKGDKEHNDDDEEEDREELEDEELSESSSESSVSLS
ncbi:hypothetical protein E2C01_005127 [Portunus trituberculatus]|uniref:Uncharacterized protein n=1 Tax=Portunus trituberculatus TaxID=210409 RepID=A0A5B7CYA6_PORTR|nr:hypothetical protein [Portunus trituberculatus]